MDFMTYSEKLGLGFDDVYKQQAFLNRMYNVINNSEIKFPSGLERIFASEIGLKYSPTYDSVFGTHQIEVLSNAWGYIERFKDFKLQLASIVFLTNLFKVTEKYEFNYLYEGLIRSLDFSHILYQVEKDGDQIFIFPKGSPILDKAEIQTPLSQLDAYPKSKHSFTYSLKMYNDLNDSNASIVADSFRKSLETFFQEFFNSDKNLENLKSEYGRFLKDRGIPSELSANFESLLKAYTNYNNNYAKHHDKSTKLVLEYLLYETGNIIRLLLTIKDN